MDRAALCQRLSEMLETATGNPIEGLTEAASLRNDLGLDSVDFVQFVMQLQTDLGVELSSAELEPIKTVGELIDVVQARLPGTTKRAA